MDRDWSIITKSRGGTVSVIRDLTLEEARQIYERLDPWFGHTTTVYRHPNGGSGSGGCIGRRIEDGDIEIREVFGPPSWDRNEVRHWAEWPKITYVDLDDNGKPIPAEAALTKSTV